MQCRELRELADSFLTGQLLVETNHEVVRHLESCPDCRAEIAGRRALRDSLRAALARDPELQPRPEFREELAARLRPPNAATSRRSLLKSWWTLAAGLVLAAGGGLVMRDSQSRSRLAALARVAAGDHQNCAVRFNLAERPIPLEEAGRRYGAPFTALATFELPALGTPLSAIDRHACVYQGRRFGHIVFRYAGAVVSLLVTNGEAPGAPQLEARGARPAVASLPAGRFVGFVVADLDAQDVLRLAQAIAAPLSRQLES